MVFMFQSSHRQAQRASPVENQTAPLPDVVAFMNKEGFVVYDFCGQMRRESDYALFQADAAFARREGNLRAPRRFWLSEP